MINKLRAIKNIISSKNNKSSDISHGAFNCIVCGNENVQMNPLPSYYLAQGHKYQHIYNPYFIETINFEHYTCSECNASDRDRLYALYLKDFFEQADRQINLLDIAPAAALRSFIKRFDKVNYRSVDLMMDDVDDKLDITNMHLYREGQFDLFICSHVLEHIPDDIQAMRELYRVLKEGGKGIAMVPINLSVNETTEDPECTDVAMRWKMFGQDDHIRMYAKKDFVQRLESVGFTVQQLGEAHFGKQAFESNAIFPTSILYIVTK
jgi:SAM-dependent methyltransferase